MLPPQNNDLTESSTPPVRSEPNGPLAETGAMEEAVRRLKPSFKTDQLTSPDVNENENFMSLAMNVGTTAHDPETENAITQENFGRSTEEVVTEEAAIASVLESGSYVNLVASLFTESTSSFDNERDQEDNFPNGEHVITEEDISAMWPSLKIEPVKMSPAVKKGENFMSVAIKFEITALDEKTGKRKKGFLLMKQLPKSDHPLIYQCYKAFANEAAFYNKVLPFLQGLANIPLSFPPCLAATEKFILLRHLGNDGFQMANRRSGLNLDHCLLVLNELGKFHATSLAAKIENPDKFDEMKSLLKEWQVNEKNELFNIFVDDSIKMSTKVAANPASRTIFKLKQLQGRGLQVLGPKMTPTEPLAVINHGDLWANNLLFRYLSETPKPPTEVCLLDLQMARYGSPALDILYFIFSSSSPGVLSKHFKTLITGYHSSLAYHSNIFSPEAPEFSLQDIVEEVRNKIMYPLVVSLLVLPVVTAPITIPNLDNVSVDMLKDPVFVEKIQGRLMSEEYKQKVNEIFDFCDELWSGNLWN